MKFITTLTFSTFLSTAAYAGGTECCNMSCNIIMKPSILERLTSVDMPVSKPHTVIVKAPQTRLDSKATARNEYGLPPMPAADPNNPDRIIVPVAIPIKVGDGPTDVSIDKLDQPHKELYGSDLTVWNQFCRKRIPSEVGAWRYTLCNSLDRTFSK